jgi:pyridoxine/pyridoxamine 5'-phosphate oxidase
MTVAGNAHDSEYFRRRAAEARASAYCKDRSEAMEVAGDLALAFAALARRKASVAEVAADPSPQLGDALA